MAGYVAQTWGAWNEDEQVTKHRANYDAGTHEFILVEGSIAGLLATEVEPNHLWLVKLYLLPAYRNKGLGSAVIATVKARARSLGKPVRLRVLRVNAGAKRLYERHGFKVVQEAPERFFMEGEA